MPDQVARRVVDGVPPPTAPDGAATGALAWSLKDDCYRGWSTEPQRAVEAADALRRLAEPDDAPAEVRALAEWTAGIACLVRGDMAEADASFLRAGDAFRALGDRQHAAETQVPRIMALAMLGRHEQAAECAKDTQQAFVALGDSIAAAKVSLNLGSLELRRERYPDSVRHYRDATVLFARGGDREHSIMADIGVGDALTALGDFDEAVLTYARARMRASTHGFPVLEAMIEESMALLDLSRGHYRDALAGFEKSRRGYERLKMPQQLAIAEKQLADAYLELNLLPEAMQLYGSVLREFGALDMPDDAAWTSVQFGRALALSGRIDAARESLLSAASAFESGANDVGTASVSLARAELELSRGESADALALATSATIAFGRAALPERALRADVVRAEALLALKRPGEARVGFADARARASTMGLLALQVRCLTGEGLATAAIGDTRRARESLAIAIARFEEMRAALPGDDIRSAFLTDNLRPYRALLEITLGELDDGEAGRAVPSGAAADVLRQLDRLRARSLAERLSGHAADTAEPGATAALRARLDWLYRRVRRLEEEGSPSAALTAELHDTEHALLETARRARLAASSQATVPQAGAAVGSGEPAGRGRDPAAAGGDVDVARLQSLLGPRDALVEYGVAGDELIACVVRHSSIELVRGMASWADVVEAASAVRFQLETLRHGASHLSQHLPVLTRRIEARLAALHALAWAPVAAHLCGADNVLVVPHAQLGNVPFAALCDADGPIGARHAITVAPSARIAESVLAREPSSGRRAVVLGEGTRLPHATVEAEAVARLYPGSTLLVGEQARSTSLLPAIGRADVVHLACHGQFRSDNPTFSALHLVDGALTAATAESLVLDRATVVLSACETAVTGEGRGDERGDERIGLVRAFLIAGASTVVASLWPVDDRTTSEFMVFFHAGLAAGLRPAMALRDAQRAIRETQAHPFYWAAFAAFGRA